MPAPRFPSLLIALALGSGGPVWADGVAGPYLAGRVASIQSDYAAAATYFNQSLTADPGNQDIQVNAILAEMGLGEFEKAEAIARTFEAEGGKGGLSDLAVLAVLAHTADFSAILADMDKGRAAGPLVDGFLRAWAQLGTGEMSEAGAGLDARAKKREVASFAMLHNPME